MAVCIATCCSADHGTAAGRLAAAVTGAAAFAGFAVLLVTFAACCRAAAAAAVISVAVGGLIALAAITVAFLTPARAAACPGRNHQTVP